MKKYRKLSKFCIWTIIYVSIFILLVALYAILDINDVINKYCIKVATPKHYMANVNIVLIFLTAITYGGCSLFNLLSHRAIEDSRMHCLSIILSAFFLIIENALLHAPIEGMNALEVTQVVSDPYYEVIMGVFSAAALGVVTFASLKFSFEISTKQKRFTETSEVKPVILIKKYKDKYYADIDRHDCYLCGVYLGKIEKIEYIDIKKSGTKFEMYNLFFPNRRTFYKKGKNRELKLTDLAPSAPALEEIYKKDFTYFIFRDVQSYYYLVKIPSSENDYKVFGVSESIMTRLVYKFGRAKYNNSDKNIKYEAMDWFNIPYNFYPEYEAKI